MRNRFPADSSLRRRAGLLVGAGILTIAVSALVLHSYRQSHYDVGTDPAVEELASTDVLEPLAGEPETPRPAIWQVPEVEPRDRSDKPLLELVGVYTGNGQDGAALIRVKDGPASTYRVGDKITGNRELIEVRDSYVLLQNDQYVERLRLRHRALDPQFRPEDLQAWAEQLAGRSRNSDNPADENR